MLKCAFISNTYPPPPPSLCAVFTPPLRKRHGSMKIRVDNTPHF